MRFVESDHYRDRIGRFARRPDRNVMGVELAGPWTGNAATEVRETVSVLLAEYDVPLERVEVGSWVDEIGQYAGKSNTSIHVSPRFLDDADSDAREKEWAGISLAGTYGRPGTIVHEFGHILDGLLLTDHRKEYDEIRDWLSATLESPLGTLPRRRLGLEAPSPYGAENDFEWVAEAFTDWFFNGENAQPNSQHIGRIIDRALRR